MNGEQLFDRAQYNVPRPEPDNSALLEQYKDWESEITPWPEPKLPIAVHAERVDEVLDKLLSTLQAGEFPYNLADARSPHIPENMPTTLERGGREHAMFHFACCYYMRGGIKSFTAYTRLGGCMIRALICLTVIKLLQTLAVTWSPRRLMWSGWPKSLKMTR